MAVADEELAGLRAEVERLLDSRALVVERANMAAARAEAAEAERDAMRARMEAVEASLRESDKRLFADADAQDTFSDPEASGYAHGLMQGVEEIGLTLAALASAVPSTGEAEAENAALRATVARVEALADEWAVGAAEGVKNAPLDRGVLEDAKFVMRCAIALRAALAPAPDLMAAADAEAVPEVRHNHFTRDVRAPGDCPACDRYHARAAADAEAANDTRPKAGE